jgi:hypothetical protein
MVLAASAIEVSGFTEMTLRVMIWLARIDMLQWRIAINMDEGYVMGLSCHLMEVKSQIGPWY